MIEATGLAGVFIEEMSFEDFLADKRTQQAVLMNLIIVGEAATRLIVVSRCSSPAIPACRGRG